MYQIVKRRMLNPSIVLLEIEAKEISEAALPGQFVIVRAKEDSERIPFTIMETNPKAGTVSIALQIVGYSTKELAMLKQGDSVNNIVGPLGKPSEIEKKERVIVIGGGAGTAIMYPIVKKFHSLGTDTIAICGYRNKDLVILEDEVTKASNTFIKMSDDGSWGRKGLVTLPLEEILASGKHVDEVFAIGPLIMMKFVCQTTKKYNVKTTISMNPLMIDGTGMCGCCRIMVDGKMKFACVDGPDFDGHKVDFDSAMMRNTMYSSWERKKYEENCNLLMEDK